MKKLLSSIIILLTGILSLQAQPVAEFTYKLDNGISVKTERCWNQVWIQQSYAPLAAGDNTPVAVKIRVLGDLISGSSFKLFDKGKEIKQQGAAAGTYDLKMIFKLSGKPGTLSFIANNIVIKPKTETTVSVTLYDYQVNIQESPGSLKGLSAYDSKVVSYKNALGKESNKGLPVFYAKGKHDSPITPAEATNETSGKIKPGSYDIQITISISGQKQKVWLENFIMKPDVNYKISINLNGGNIVYSGGNKDVKMMYLYPAGTAARQTGNPARIKNIEIAGYETSPEASPCAPGSYDILLDFKNGTKYEWRKNIAVNSSSRTDVK